MNTHEIHVRSIRWIETFVREHPGCTAREICTAMGRDKSTVHNDLAEMRRDGVIRAEHVRTGRRGNDRAFAYYVEEAEA